MSRHYSQTLEIKATPAQIWPVLADVTRGTEWTPSITRVVPLTSGPFGVGSRARVHQPGLPPAFWRVTGWNPGRQFTWVSLAPACAWSNWGQSSAGNSCHRPARECESGREPGNFRGAEVEAVALPLPAAC